MATVEKGSLLKNVHVKIKDNQEEKGNSKEEAKVDFGEEQKEEEGSNLSSKNKINENEEDKIEFSDGENEEEKNEDSKLIQDNIGNIEENKSNIIEPAGEENNNNNYIETNNEMINKSGNKSGSQNNSSFLNSRNYNMIQQNNLSNDNNFASTGENTYLNRDNPFLTNGKFMQIQPHFNIFSRQMGELRDGIYENTKKCLIFKSSLQQSENLIREQSNIVVKDMIDKIFNLRKMFLNANKTISQTINEVNFNMNKLKVAQTKVKKDINDCDHRINACEKTIGYKLLGTPNYSFMRRYNSTLPNQ